MKEEPQMEYKLSQVNLTILQVNNKKRDSQCGLNKDR